MTVAIILVKFRAVLIRIDIVCLSMVRSVKVRHSIIGKLTAGVVENVLAQEFTDFLLDLAFWQVFSEPVQFACVCHRAQALACSVRKIVQLHLSAKKLDLHWCTDW